jgi:hypothetical protein
MRGQASYYGRVTTANESRPYFLRSARLGFGTWSTEDLDLAVALWGDLRVTRLIGGPFPEDQIRDRSRGYASEAARTAIAHAFGALAIRQLVAGHHPENRASRRLLERLGFRYLSDDLYPPTGLHHPTYLLRRDDVDDC